MPVPGKTAARLDAVGELDGVELHVVRWRENEATVAAARPQSLP
jgi:hypothetical protein